MAQETTIILKDAAGVDRTFRAFLNDDGKYSLISISQNTGEQKIAEGKFFSAEYTLPLENGQGFDLILFTAPDAAAFDFDVSALADTTFQMYEDCVESGDGANVEIVNINRVIGGLPANFTLKSNPTTITDDGTLIVDRNIGTSKDYIATQETSGARFLLKPNSKYLFRLTSLSNSNKVQFVINLIEK